MDAAPDSGMPEPYTQQEQLVARLQPESEPEERLVRQIALCSVKLDAHCDPADQSRRAVAEGA